MIHAVREAEGWVATTLATPNVLSTWCLAVGPDGYPRVAFPRSLDGSLRSGPAVVATFDGADWNLAETGENGSPRDRSVDPQGHSHVTLIGDGGDGESWERQQFGARTDAAEVSAADVGPDGILHVVTGGREAPWIEYFRVGGPPLDVDASGLRVIPVRDGVAVRGRIVVRNVDEHRSVERVLRFARAARDEFRAGDEPAGRERRIPSLRPGTRRSIQVSIVLRHPAPGERLLGVIDLRSSRDGPATVLAVPLGE